MQRKFLVVDDESSVREMFKSAFGDAGYEVLLAEDGHGALRIIEYERDLYVIFLDLRLFGMNGIDLCRQIKTKNPICIIYAITGWSGLFEIEECREAGFDDYFTKPVSLELLFEAVENAFAKLDRWEKRFPQLALKN